MEDIFSEEQSVPQGRTPVQAGTETAIKQAPAEVRAQAAPQAAENWAPAQAAPQATENWAPAQAAPQATENWARGLAKTKMTAVFTLLLDDISGCWNSDPEQTPLFNPAAEIAGLQDEAALGKWAEGAFEKILGEARLRRSGNFPLPLLKAVTFIQEHYAEPIQLGSAADAAQVSSAYMSRLFSEHLKTSFSDYLTDLRIEKSEKLLLESGLSIKEIAFAVGYQDPNYFSRIFRKARGTAPSAYGQKP
jgi:AraC-like DNA-binding protein